MNVSEGQFLLNRTNLTLYALNTDPQEHSYLTPELNFRVEKIQVLSLENVSSSTIACNIYTSLQLKWFFFQPGNP